MERPRHRRVFLLGNGLSVGCNPEFYSLEALTAGVRERLAELTTSDGEPLLVQVDGIVSAVSTDEERRTPQHSFESLAGPIDRLSSMFTEIGPLAKLLGEAEQEAALQRLGITLRGVYRRVVGAVLERVMQHPMPESDWGPINEMALYLVEVARQQGSLDVFTLNYDALLDSAFLTVDRPGVALADEFQGNWHHGLWVHMPGGEQVGLRTLGWREGLYDPGGTLVRMHHLHGAGMWVGYEGHVYKARRLEEMRAVNLFTSWAVGAETEVEPVVLLGDQKRTWAARRPFNETYADLTAAVAVADEVVIAGYGFGDLPVNRVLRAAVQDATVTVVNPREGVERLARTALGRNVAIRVIARPLPGGLAAVG